MFRLRNSKIMSLSSWNNNFRPWKLMTRWRVRLEIKLFILGLIVWIIANSGKMMTKRKFANSSNYLSERNEFFCRRILSSIKKWKTCKINSNLNDPNSSSKFKIYKKKSPICKYPSLKRIICCKRSSSCWKLFEIRRTFSISRSILPISRTSSSRWKSIAVISNNLTKDSKI